MNSSELKTLKDKEIGAEKIILDNIEKVKNPIVYFDGDKYSLIILHMVRKIKKTPVIFIETSLEFEDIYKYIDKMKRLWGLNLIKIIHTVNIDEKNYNTCFSIKNEAINKVIKEHNIDCLFTDMDSKNHVFVNPISSFVEEDIWNYIMKYNLPYCSLYDKGYEEIDFKPYAKKTDISERKDEEKIKQKLKQLGYL